MENGKTVVLIEPTVLYNGRSIASVEFDYIGERELVERVRKAQKSIGFHVDAGA